MNNQRLFRVTMIDDASLFERLTRELRFLIYQLHLGWAAWKRDPVAFSRSTLWEGWLQLRRAAAPRVMASLATAMLVILSAGLALVWLDNRSQGNSFVREDPKETGLIVDISQIPTAPKEGQGIGAGTKGRVGFQSGKGEGSGQKRKRSTGGGSGGMGDKSPAPVGKLPPPADIPAPIPKLPAVQKSTLPVAGIDIDRALWKNLAMAVYGDPRSKSSVPSNGPGEGGGMGTAAGTGIGEGNGPGFGAGSDGNTGGDHKGLGCCGSGGGRGNNVDDPDHVYPAPQVTERARVIAKPEPQYTEEARRNAVTGSVVLRVVFSRSGEVTNIRAVQSLPFGLTERAIAAARMIRFRPATRDGRAVNVYMQLEYNFNLY
ncbi:MAG TPA: energy transducer TonB [Pyrinomonadaceae bacterium]|nr:energy transducer TonB [Pyrinomonadaceae bacterium]